MHYVCMYKSTYVLSICEYILMGMLIFIYMQLCVFVSYIFMYVSISFYI
jgi:hypothetical protein